MYLAHNFFSLVLLGMYLEWHMCLVWKTGLWCLWIALVLCSWYRTVLSPLELLKSWIELVWVNNCLASKANEIQVMPYICVMTMTSTFSCLCKKYRMFIYNIVSKGVLSYWIYFVLSRMDSSIAHQQLMCLQQAQVTQIWKTTF